MSDFLYEKYYTFQREEKYPLQVYEEKIFITSVQCVCIISAFVNICVVFI